MPDRARRGIRVLELADGELLGFREQTLDPLPADEDRLRAFFVAAWEWATARDAELTMPQDLWDVDLLAAADDLEGFRTLFADPARRRAALARAEARRLGVACTEALAVELYTAIDPRVEFTAKEQLEALSRLLRHHPPLRGAVLKALDDLLDEGRLTCWYDDLPDVVMSVRVLGKVRMVAEELGDAELMQWVRRRTF